MRKLTNKFLLAMLLITSAMSFVSCEAIAAQNITHNSAATVNGNQNMTRPGTNDNQNMNSRPVTKGNQNSNNLPGTNSNTNRNAGQGANRNQVK